MSEIETFAKSIVKSAAKKLSPVTFIDGQVRKMERGDLEYLATAYLLAQLKNRQRHEVLTIERDATVQRVAKIEAALSTPEALAAREELERQRDEEDARIAADFWQSMSGAIEKFKNDLHTEWTTELLASEFALGDGTKVRWGDATRENHEYRIAMHKKNAIAGMEGVARHQQAIEEMDRREAGTLYEAVRMAA